MPIESTLTAIPPTAVAHELARYGTDQHYAIALDRLLTGIAAGSPD